MNRPDLDEFAELWQAEPDPAEQAELEAYARRARRRGRLLSYIEYAFILLWIFITIAGLMVSKNSVTIALAVPLMIALVWITWKRRQVHQMARTLDTADRMAFIESSLRNARTNLRRHTRNLALLPLLVPMALAFKVSTRTGGGPQEIWEAFLLWTQTVRAPITLVILMIVAAFSLRTRRKIKSEIQQLEGLRRRYEAEKSRDEEGPDRT